MSVTAGTHQRQPVLVDFLDLNAAGLLDTSIAAHLMRDGGQSSLCSTRGGSLV